MPGRWALHGTGNEFHFLYSIRKQLGIALTKMYWLLGHKSELPTGNKLLMYGTILNPIWTYGIQLWGTASTSNTERFQWKALRMIADTPWSVPNTVIRRDLHTPTVTVEIRRYSSQYSAPPKRSSSEPHGATRQQDTCQMICLPDC
jgi:hypothetical protein